MDKREFLELFDIQYRRDLIEPGVQREAIPPEDPIVVRHNSTQFKSGFISYSRLNEHNVEAEIDEQIAFFPTWVTNSSGRYMTTTARQTCASGWRGAGL